MLKEKFFIFCCCFLTLLILSQGIFAKSSSKDKKDFYSWLKQLRNSKYSYTSTLDQKEYLTREIAHLTNTVKKGKYKVYNIPFKILIVDSIDRLQNHTYQIVNQQNNPIENTNHLHSNQTTNFFTTKTDSYIMQATPTNDDSITNQNQKETVENKAEKIYRDNSLKFNVGQKTGIFHLYTLFLHPTKYYTQHITKQTYRVINKVYFYIGVFSPYFFIILLLGLSFLKPLKLLRKSHCFFIFSFLSHRLNFSSLLSISIGLICFTIASVFYSTVFLLIAFFLIFIISHFYKLLQEMLIPLLLLIIFTFFWKTYGNTTLFSELILANTPLWIGMNLFLLLLSPLLALALLLLLTLHFPLLIFNYLLYITGGILIVLLTQIYFFRKPLLSLVNRLNK